MESPEDIEKALSKLVPSALSERGQRNLEDLIDSLAASEAVVEMTPPKRRYFAWAGGIGAAAAAVALSLSIPLAGPGTGSPNPGTGQKSGVVPAGNIFPDEDRVLLLEQVERVEAAEPEDLVWESDGIAHRAWRFRVVNENRVQDVQTGYEVTVSSPHEKVVLMPVTAF